MRRKNASNLLLVIFSVRLIPLTASSLKLESKIHLGSAINQRVKCAYPSIQSIPRGGGGSVDEETLQGSKKKRKKTKSSSKRIDLKKEKATIQEALKQKDSAEALGDAVRERTEDWIETDPLFDRLDASINSIGWAMGVGITQDGGGSVEAAPSSVVAHYLLKSHGGAHALQSVCSLLAVLLSIAACLSPTGKAWQQIFLKRALLSAMTKHLAGLLAATGITASAIPKVGLGQARRWMEQLARDPVSQYVFYTALLLVWLGVTTSPTCWYMNLRVVSKYIPWVLMGPILLRESISILFVVSDILLLLHQSSSNPNPVAAAIWKAGHGTANAILSLLVTPTVWRTSTVAQRQVILARLVAKLSLIFELIVGSLVVADALVGIWDFTMLTPRPKLLDIVWRIACARLYTNFLWVRRTKLRQLGQDVRGGAAQVPVRILDALFDPCGAMGIDKSAMGHQQQQQWTWKDYVVIGLGLDEDN